MGKVQVPNNGDIGIQPDAGMTTRTRFNAGWDNTMRLSPHIRTTERTSRQQKDIEALQKHHMLQVRPARPLQRVMPLQRGRTIKNEG